MSGQLKNDTGERKLRVTLLSAGWKASSDGDLTTMNRELATQMAKHPNVEVSVFLPQCSEEDKKDADSYNVKLIEAVKLSGFEPVDWLASVPEGHAMDCVLGHGVALGRQIQIIRKNPKYSHCKWIQVVHTSPEEIGMYKSISEGQKMHQTEIELCKMADQVVTIGPKLTDAYKNQLGKQDVFNLMPSILTEFLNVQQARDERRTFCVLVTESGDSEDFDVKGYDIAVKAIANLKDKSYQLKFTSKQRGKEDELADRLLQCGIGRNQLIICSFDENRETLANLFSAVDIAILPSKAEGFGLSALEAISAGLPVLVSGNSGIAEALKEVPNGPQCIVDSEDPADWARAIKAVRNKKRNVRLEEAKILRGNYLQKYNWVESCDFLVEKMRNLAFGGELNVKVAVDDLKPEEQNMQTGMLATESVGCQEVQQPGASATSAASGSVSYPQTEDLKASKERDFQLIFRDCYHSTKPQSIEEWNWFREHLKEMRVIITGVSDGSLVITVKCESLMILEEFWADYSSGHLGEVVQNCFVTEKILKELNLAELRLKTTIDIEEYNTCKMFFEEDALRGSTSRSPQKKEQWEKSEWKTKIFEMAKLEGMLPLPGSSIFGPEEELVEPRMKLQRIKGALSSEFHSISSTSESPQNQEELKKRKQKTKIDEKGSFPVLQFSTIDLEKKLDGLSMELQRLRREVTLPSPELLTADLEEKLKELLTELERQRDKGSLPPTFSTIEVEVDELLKKFQKWRIEGGLSSEFHSTSSTSESPQKKGQWEKSEEKTKIMETEKLEGTSPLIVEPTTGHGKELEERWGRKGMLPLPGYSTFDPEEELEELRKKLLIMKGSLHSLPTTDLKEKLEQVFEEIRMLRTKGSFSVLKLSTTDLEKKLAELSMELHRLRMEGTLPPPELFTADLEDELERLIELIWTLQERKEEKGSSHFHLATIGTVIRLRKELEEVKMEALENAVYPTIGSGLAKFDVSLPEELQNYVSYLLDESAKLHLRKQVLQPPRALEELREAMDKDELKTFLTIHIREGAWQVVLLFTDELPRVKLPRDWCDIIHIEDEDEEVSNEVIYSSTSGILKVWPTKYDPSLVTLCNAITNKDWKVTRLILSLSRIPDEGLKNLSTALTQSELYSLTLHETALQSQGLKHLCNALTSVNCRLTNLNFRGNELGDVGIMHLCNALTSVDCTLTSLNVRCNNLGDVGIRHLCNALTSVNCRLTNLNVSLNKLGDVGIMHLCNALTSVDCTLTSLNVSNSELGDVGIRHLSKALNSVNCRLTSLNVSANQFGDNGLQHLCAALTSRNCALTKLKVRLNRLGDRGIQELFEVLTSGFCTLTSLDVSCNKFGDVGIKLLCKALTDTKCKLRSLNLCSNRYVTEDGKKYLSQMLTGTDWEDKGALRLSRSTTK